VDLVEQCCSHQCHILRVFSLASTGPSDRQSVAQLSAYTPVLDMIEY